MKKTNIKKGATRIKEICEDMHISTRHLALTVGLMPQNLYDILAGRCGLSERVAMKINKALPNYSIEWLLSEEDSSASDDVNNDSPKESKATRRPYAGVKATETYADSKDRYIEWLQKQLEKEREGNKRLLNIILNKEKQYSYENLYIDTD